MSKSDTGYCYDYDLPKGLIANEPAKPRDNSRLLVVDTKTGLLHEDRFLNISKYLPANSLLVLNNTKVFPARLRLRRENDSEVSILFLINEWEKTAYIKGLPNREILISESLSLEGRAVVRAVSHENQEFTFELQVGPDEFIDIVQNNGETPLPSYIKSAMKEDELRNVYQTTFAKIPRSVAAPTASLHFTERVFRSLESKHVDIAEVTLHVGRGTFSPVKTENFISNTLHSEPVIIEESTARKIDLCKKSGRPIIVAGTTALRAVESASDAILSGGGYCGHTEIFIHPPYKFKLVDHMITNFHLPKTSLIMLVDAFLQYKESKIGWREVYEYAIKNKFRFFSFGDAMLIL